MSEIAYRPATLDDAAEVHALLLRLAPEIPLLVDTLEREEALYVVVRNCARSGESWVAVRADGRIVGFLLAEPNQRGRHYAEHEIIELRYAGLAGGHRNRGIFGQLVGKVLARMLPVTTTVPAHNGAGAAARLERLGFRKTGSAGGETRLRWRPGAGDA